MSDQLEAILTVLPRLEAAGFVHMLSGSIASSVYGKPRMTRDVDIVVELGEADVDRFVQLFEAGTYYLDTKAIRTAVRDRDMFNIIEVPKAVKFDFIVRKESEYRRLELARRRRVTYGGAEVWAVSPEDLVLSKLHWARTSRSEVQLADVREVLAKRADFDWTYAERWAPALGVEQLLREVRS